LTADLLTKWWALRSLERVLPGGETIGTPKDITPWMSLVLARNRGGAWGLLQTADEHVRRPFFLVISLLAIVFIVSLYRRVHPQQHALKWGLPLVLGGALGNLVDRVRYSWVVDFIDMRAVWVRYLNELIAKIWHTHAVTDHWPTYNVADIAICIGVGLMAIDMFTSRRIPKTHVSGVASGPEPLPVTSPEPGVSTPQTSQPPPAGPAL
jgi:signal peptidase II